MQASKTGCLICGEPLVYYEKAKELPCSICGKNYVTQAACKENHYVCDSCHIQKGYQTITDYAIQTASKNPIEIARQMMNQKFIYMHGPEHHYLIAAALLSAFSNASTTILLEDSLEQAYLRAKNVPGGICGFWGSCGASIGAGIFMSVVTKATPFSTKEWQLSNSLTALCLEKIAQNGGPRCCKRNVFLAIETAIPFVDEHLKIKLEHQPIVCSYFMQNQECKKENCIYYPKSKGQKN